MSVRGAAEPVKREPNLQGIVPPAKALETSLLDNATALEGKKIQNRCATPEKQVVLQARNLAEIQAQSDQWKQRCQQLWGVVDVHTRCPEPLSLSPGEGLIPLIAGLCALWFGVMAKAVAFVDGNENYEATAAVLLLMIGAACCIYYLFYKKMRKRHLQPVL